MHAFINSKQVSLNLGRFFRVYPEGVLSAETPVDKLIIDTAGESKVLRDYHKQGQEAISAGISNISADAGLQIVDESQLVKWQHLPVRFGRVSAKLLADELHLHEESAPLAMQCEMLLKVKRNKTHFRIAIVNAFGANLGDTTLGMTALRVVAKIFEEKFETFSVDLFIGPTSHISNQNIIKTEPWVLNVFSESPSLQDFSRYDAYIDFTNLIYLPKFQEMPTVDWYLWWMGLDPMQIAIEEKRNQLCIPWRIWQDLSQLIKGTSGKRVLFNAKASVPLRSCPLDVASKLVKKILDNDKSVHVIVPHEFDLKHSRLTSFHDKLPSAEHFMALVAQVDAVITVDTFAVHAADAAAVPCVSLFASVPPGSYPYYPLNEGILIPNGENLPGYKKSKITNDEEWEAMQQEYHKAWSNVQAISLLNSINVLDKKKKEARTPIKIELRNEVVQSKSNLICKDGLYQFRNTSISRNWQDAHLKLLKYAESILKPGMICLQFGAGSPDLSVGVAHRLGDWGKLHIVEPRRHFAAMVGLNLANEIAFGQVHLHRVMIGKEPKFVQFESTDPYSEINPAQWGNLRQVEKVRVIQVEEISLAYCQLIVIQPPMPSAMVLEGVKDFVRIHKPAIAVGPIDKDGLRVIAGLLKSIEYSMWVEIVERENDSDSFCMLAFPNERKVNLTGFKKVKI